MNQFPIGGPRKPVQDALKSRGFVMSGWSDKWWKRADGVEAGIYATGSKLTVRIGQTTLFDGPMAEALEFLDAQQVTK